MCVLQVYVGVQSDVYACALGYGPGLGVPVADGRVTVGEAITAMSLHILQCRSAVTLQYRSPYIW